LHYIAKKSQTPKCGDCKKSLQSLYALRPKAYRLLAKRKRRVSRAYGGSRCYLCTRNRIVRAFLVEEQKIVKAVLKTRGKKVAKKSTKKKK
jgi:large subunit ribosomal protein L34e